MGQPSASVQDDGASGELTLARFPFALAASEGNRKRGHVALASTTSKKPVTYETSLHTDNTVLL